MFQGKQNYDYYTVTQQIQNLQHDNKQQQHQGHTKLKGAWSSFNQNLFSISKSLHCFSNAFLIVNKDLKVSRRVLSSIFVYKH